MESLSLLNLMITICLIIGGIAAYRHGFTRTANEVQGRVISALQSEIQALHDRINALEKENSRLSHTITTICSALKQRGIHIAIDGDMVSIHDGTSGSYIYNTRGYDTHESETRSGQADMDDMDRAASPRTGQTAKRRSKKRVSAVPEEV